jgi:tryptophanyl-tRNA synthetase
MTRDMAGYFNRAFGTEIFPLPQERLDVAALVPGTDGKKMSKSYGNTIDIFAEGSALKKPIMNIQTDGKGLHDPLDPATCNVFALYSLFATPAEKEEMAKRYRAGGYGYGNAKKALLEKADAYFAPYREKRKKLAADPEYVENVLHQGAKRARYEAQQTMELVREAVGMRARPVVG